MVVGFPLAVGLEFASGDVVEVDIRGMKFLRHGFNPRSEGGQFAVDAIGVALFVCLSRREGEEDWGGSLGTDFIDETAQITAEGINHFLLASFLDGDEDRVGGERLLAILAFVGRTGTVVVDRTVVVMTQFKDDVVALLNAFQYIGPKAAIESAWTGATEGMILHGDFVLVEELVGKVTPTPLTVVAIAERAVAHGGIADEEENGIVATTRRTTNRTYLIGFGK